MDWFEINIHMKALKIVFQNIKNVCNILLSVNKNVTHKYIKNDPNFILDSHRVKKKKKYCRKYAYIFTMVISRW